MKERKLVCGVGVNTYESKVTVGGKEIKSHSVWKGMIQRCYDENKRKSNMSYDDCTVADAWLDFKNFKEWFDANYRWDLADSGIDLEIDKDLLVNGNRVYSPETCCIIPRRINIFLSKRTLNNKFGYIGIQPAGKKWRARIRDFYTSELKHIGTYSTQENASDAYNIARELEATKAKEYMRELGYSEDIINKIK